MIPNNRFLRINEPAIEACDYRVKKHYSALLDWFKRNLDYELFLLENKLKYKIEQGDVYEVDFGRNLGSELNERHYAVVLHHSDEDAQNIVVVPLTTKLHYSYGEAVELGYLPGVKTNEVSYAKISQIRTVDKVRIYLRPIINNNYEKGFSNTIGPVTKLTSEQFKVIVSGLNKLINNRL